MSDTIPSIDNEIAVAENETNQYNEYIMNIHPTSTNEQEIKNFQDFFDAEPADHTKDNILNLSDIIDKSLDESFDNYNRDTPPCQNTLQNNSFENDVNLYGVKPESEPEPTIPTDSDTIQSLKDEIAGLQKKYSSLENELKDKNIKIEELEWAAVYNQEIIESVSGPKQEIHDISLELMEASRLAEGYRIKLEQALNAINALKSLSIQSLQIDSSKKSKSTSREIFSCNCIYKFPGKILGLQKINFDEEQMDLKTTDQIAINGTYNNHKIILTFTEVEAILNRIYYYIINAPYSEFVFAEKKNIKLLELLRGDTIVDDSFYRVGSNLIDAKKGANIMSYVGYYLANKNKIDNVVNSMCGDSNCIINDS